MLCALFVHTSRYKGRWVGVFAGVMPENEKQKAPYKLVFKGGNRLNGLVRVSGGKNTAVAVIPAALLCDEVCQIENLPDISDVRALVDILESLGAKVEYVPDQYMRIDPRPATGWQVEQNLCERLRASYYLLGALLGREKKAQVYMPGGCAIGTRPIDQHLRGFEALQANVVHVCDCITAEGREMCGAKDFFFDVVTVGGTINVMLAAVKTPGLTILHNAAKEPHIVDLANFLNSMGARVKGAGTDIIRITGVEYLHGTTYTVIPDQIETGTLMIAAAATHGEVTIQGCIPTHMEALTAKLLEMGVKVVEKDDSIYVRSLGSHRAVNIKTQVYPGFPTDLQQPMSVLLTTARGKSEIRETIYEHRLQHLKELVRMGAKVDFDGDERAVQRAMIHGIPETDLQGCPVTATDLRAGAALIIAGLMAHGTTEIYNTHFIERGYERIEEKLRALGADIHREELPEDEERQ